MKNENLLELLLAIQYWYSKKSGPDSYRPHYVCPVCEKSWELNENPRHRPMCWYPTLEKSLQTEYNQS